MEEDSRETQLAIPAAVLRDKLCRLVNPQAAHEWREMMDGLRVAVGVFYDGLAADIRGEVEDEAPSTAKTRDLLANFVKLSESAQFAPLSAAQWHSADGEFTFQFPVDVKWGDFEVKYLKTFFDLSHGGGYFGAAADAAPPFADKILILTKGRGMETREGRFVQDKLNLLLCVMWRKMKRAVGMLEAPPVAATPPPEACLLTDICRERGILNVLAAHNKIQTATFEEVILVYFPKNDKATAGAAAEEKRNMVIESYRNVPWEDLEAILPYKEVRLMPVHFFEMLIYAAMIAAALYYMVEAFVLGNEQEGEAEHGGELLVFLQLVTLSIGKQIYDLSFYYGTLKVAHMKAVQDYMGRHQAGKGLAVVAKLVDDVKAQEFNEMALAYFCCWTRGPATLQEVDDLAENILLQEFGLSANFDVEDALSKLQNLDLIRLDRNRRYVITMRPAEWVAKYPTSHISNLKVK